MTEAQVRAAGKLERRFYRTSVERRVKRADGAEEDDPPMICGHASVFNQPEDLGYFTEEVAPGAFSKTIAEDDIRALFNHNPDYVLGRNTAKTLTMRQDSKGLYFEILPADTQLGRDMLTTIGRGDVSQCSIGFYARGVELSKRDGAWHRLLTDIQLFDVSPVTFPAFPTTDVSVRSIEKIAQEFRFGPEVDMQELARIYQYRHRLIELAEV